MKTVFVLLSALLLSACTTGFDPDMEEYFSSTNNGLDSDERPPKNELNVLAKKLVAEMLSNNQFVSQQNAIAVTSIVDLNSLTETNRLGHQISEGIVHYLHDSGYRVVDFKLTGTIQVTAEGDFIHSRDWKQLNNKNPIDYLVSGTLDEYEGGVYLSMRMVGVQTRVVVGSSQAFITTKQLQSFTVSPEAAKLAQQRAELDAERAQFAVDMDQVVEQKVAAALESKSEPQSVETFSLFNLEGSEAMPSPKENETKNQKVYSSDGYLVRDER